MSDVYVNSLDLAAEFSNAIAKNPFTGQSIETGSFHRSDAEVYNEFLENYDLLSDQETDIEARDAIYDREMSIPVEEAMPHKRVAFEEAEVKIDDAKDVIHMGTEAAKAMIEGISKRYGILQFEQKEDEDQLVGMGVDIRDMSGVDVRDVSGSLGIAEEVSEALGADGPDEAVEPKVPYDADYGY